MWERQRPWAYRMRRKTPSFSYGDIRRSPSGEKYSSSQATLTLVFLRSFPVKNSRQKVGERLVKRLCVPLVSIAQTTDPAC